MFTTCFIQSTASPKSLETSTTKDPSNVTLSVNMLIQAVFLSIKFFTDFTEHGDFQCSSVLVLQKSSIQSSYSHHAVLMQYSGHFLMMYSYMTLHPSYFVKELLQKSQLKSKAFDLSSSYFF